MQLLRLVPLGTAWALVQFKMVSMRSEKPINYALHHVPGPEVSPTLPLKRGY